MPGREIGPVRLTMTGETARLTGEINKATNAMRQQSQEARKLARSQRAARRRSDNFKRSIGGLAGQFHPLAIAATAAASAVAAFTAAGRQMVTVTTQMESSVARFQALVGLTAGEANEMRDAIIQISRETGTPLEELNEAMFLITSSGQRGAEAINTLRGAAEGSVTGLGTVNDLANTITAAMGAWGEANLSVEESLRSVFAAARQGKAAPEEFGQTIGRLAPLAAALGIPMSDLAALIAELSNTQDIETIRSGLGGAFRALLKPTAEGEKLLRQYGLSAERLRMIVQQEGYDAFLTTIAEAIPKADLGKIFADSQAFLVVSDQLSDSGEAVADTLEKVANTTNGELREAFEIVSDTMEKRWGRATAHINTALLELGTEILPPIVTIVSAIVDAIALFVRGIAALIRIQREGFEFIIEQWRTFYSVIGDGLENLGIVDFFKAAFEEIKLNVQFAQDLFTILWNEIKNGAQAVADFISPVTNTLSQIWSEISAGIDEVRENVNVGFQAIGNFIKTIIDDITAAVDALLEPVRWLVRQWERLRGMASETATEIRNAEASTAQIVTSQQRRALTQITPEAEGTGRLGGLERNAFDIGRGIAAGLGRNVFDTQRSTGMDFTSQRDFLVGEARRNRLAGQPATTAAEPDLFRDERVAGLAGLAEQDIISVLDARTKAAEKELEATQARGELITAEQVFLELKEELTNQILAKEKEIAEAQLIADTGATEEERQAAEAQLVRLEQELDVLKNIDLTRDDITQKINEAVAAQNKLTKATKEGTDTANQQVPVWDQLAEAAKKGAGNAQDLFKQVLDGTISAEDAMKQLIKQILLAIVKQIILIALGGAAPNPGAGNQAQSIANSFGNIFRQQGGNVVPGQPFVVGERNAEVFVPEEAGFVEPDADGRGEPNIVINVNPSGNRQTDDEMIEQLRNEMTFIAQQETYNMLTRPGAGRSGTVGR